MCWYLISQRRLAPRFPADLYRALDELDEPDRSMLTVEDPLDGLKQMQMNAKAGLTFASSLRAIVRGGSATRQPALQALQPPHGPLRGADDVARGPTMILIHDDNVAIKNHAISEGMSTMRQDDLITATSGMTALVDQARAVAWPTAEETSEAS